MPDEIVLQSVEMFFQEASSDKLYNATLVQTASGNHTVHVTWGRRGKPLRTGTKALEVSLEKAQKAFDKLIRDKRKKGYEVQTEELQPAEVAPPEGQGSGSKVAVGGRRRLGQKAQLLNVVDGEELQTLLNDAVTVAQQKLDGMRLLVHVLDEGLVATNREGFVSKLPPECAPALAGLPLGTIVDGELVKDGGVTYWLFDLLTHGEEDLRALGYLERYARLSGLELEGPVVVVPTAQTSEEKRGLFTKLQEQNAEGLVFKDGAAPYRGGRPASGGSQRKHKFIKTADVIITANAGNAYQMALLFDGSLREVGKVFAGTTNDSRAEMDNMLVAGASIVAEVKYLYATDDDILFQPVFVRIRDDKEPSACLSTQLVHTNRAGLSEV